MSEPSLVVVVGSGGVGKTSIAAAYGLLSAGAGEDTLVMTFDPSLRLKDSLGVGDAARDREVRVALEGGAPLHASLLDARATFDRLVGRYAPDEVSRRRILENRFYDHLAGHLAGVLEYMAVERLYEVATETRHQRIILDTPPTRQALDFLGAPERIVGFLDSGALRIALRPWFDEHGHLKPARRLGALGRGLEGLLDRVVGLGLLREMAEFFQAFAPLYEGFRERALAVQELLRSKRTLFVLVCGPGEERIPDTMFFARKLLETGHQLAALVVNRIHPAELAQAGPEPGEGARILAWRASSDAQGVQRLRDLLGAERPLDAVPLLAREPSDLAGLGRLSAKLSPPWRETKPHQPC